MEPTTTVAVVVTSVVLPLVSDMVNWMVEPAAALVVPEMVTAVLSVAERFTSPIGSLMFTIVEAGTGLDADMGAVEAPNALKVKAPS